MHVNPFVDCKTINDIASTIFQTPASKLNFYLYHYSSKYFYFEIPKKSGGFRPIYSPCYNIKMLQRKLKAEIGKIYSAIGCVHGFVPKRSILTNASGHCRKRVVFCLDIENFFPTIHFGRVKGMFSSKLFGCTEVAANILANLCCHQGVLPQGAPTSPIISNIICFKMDLEILKICKKYNVFYTRYADDMTFSTNENIRETMFFWKITAIIKKHGFESNKHKKTKREYNQQQRVTGITVNEFPNVNRKFIRKLRAILYDWKTRGVEEACKENLKDDLSLLTAKERLKKISYFRSKIIGQINYVGMIRGREDHVYLKLCRKLKHLDKNIRMKRKLSRTPTILTEGKSDWKHLIAALEWFQNHRHFRNLKIEFAEFEHTFGSGNLYKKLEDVTFSPKDEVYIAVFDADVVLDVSRKATYFKKWKNNVYSLRMPRENEYEKGKSIEFYYKQSDMLKKDANGRRLMLRSEFNDDGTHKGDKEIKYKGDLNKLKNMRKLFIEEKVFKGKKTMILSKNDFAENVFYKRPPFNNMDFSGFKKVFEKIEQAVDNAGYV